MLGDLSTLLIPCGRKKKGGWGLDHIDLKSLSGAMSFLGVKNGLRKIRSNKPNLLLSDSAV